MRPLLKYLPDRLQEIREFQAITGAEQPELEVMEKARQRLLYNQFIDTADADGVGLLEKAAGMKTLAGGNLEERRFALRVRMSDKRPMTVRFLKEQLRELCGPDGYELQVVPAEHKLWVRLALASKRSMAAAVDLINKLKPANLLLDIDLLYNRHGYFAGKTHSELAALSHNSLRVDVIAQ